MIDPTLRERIPQSIAYLIIAPTVIVLSIVIMQDPIIGLVAGVIGGLAKLATWV